MQAGNTATETSPKRCRLRSRRMPRRTPSVPRLIRPLLGLCALLLLAPAAASAAPVEIDGSPLNVWTDENGSLQVNVDGYPSSEWFPQTTFDPTTSASIPNNVANAGFGIIVDPQ